jgi:flagellar FliL protein
MGNSGRVLLLLIPVLLLAGGGAGFVLLRGQHHARPIEKEFPLALNELTVNLADTGRPHYLSASVTLAIKGADPEKTAAEYEAQARDAVLMVMSQRKYQELLSPEGKQALKDGILVEVGKALAKRKLEVTDVLFTTFVMD